VTTLTHQTQPTIAHVSQREAAPIACIHVRNDYPFIWKPWWSGVFI